MFPRRGLYVRSHTRVGWGLVRKPDEACPAGEKSSKTAMPRAVRILRENKQQIPVPRRASDLGIECSFSKAKSPSVDHA
jgi:hypothetical protein